MFGSGSAPPALCAQKIVELPSGFEKVQELLDAAPAAKTFPEWEHCHDADPDGLIAMVKGRYVPEPGVSCVQKRTLFPILVNISA